MDPRRYFHERRVVHPLLRWMILVAVILLAVAASGDPAGSEPATSTGARVTMRVPFFRESIDEIRALAPLREQTAPENRAIPFRRILRRSGAPGQADFPVAAPALVDPVPASSPSRLAPLLDSSFAGLGNPPHSQGDVIPPDTMGAAGPNHLVSLLNSEFGVFNKSTGALIPNQQVSLQSFWESLGTKAGQPANFPFDTKILYDQQSGRFIAVTLGGLSAPDSWVLIAVSSSSDPTGAWSKWAIDADVDNNVPPNDNVQTNNSADFPGLGVDAYNVYITANMFDGANVGQYSKMWVIPKAQLLTGSNPITWFEFFPPVSRDPISPCNPPTPSGPPVRSTFSSRDRPTTWRRPGSTTPTAPRSGTPRCRSRWPSILRRIPLRAPPNGATTTRSTRRTPAS